VTTTSPVWPSQTQVKLNGSGAGTARIGPTGHGVVWTLGTISVKTGQAVTTGVCECNVYVGDDSSATNFVGGTFSGDTGDSLPDASGTEVRLGKYVFAVWSGGVPGDIATLSITGTMEVP
jgi:hypothetical protein